MSNLKFAAAQRPEALSVEAQRRQRLIRRIDQQKEFVEQIKEGRSPRGVWVWKDEHANYFVPIKYGRLPLELKKGLFSIQCETLDGCAEALSAIREMVQKGEFDERLVKASQAIRSRFGK